MKAIRLLSVLLLALSLVAGVWLGYQQILPPPLPADFQEQPRTLAEAGDAPDLALMISHMKAMAGTVHQVDSPGLLITQDYLRDQLAQMGYEPVTQSFALSMEDIIAIRAERAAHKGSAFQPDEELIRRQTGMGDRESLTLNNIVVTIDAPGSEETIIFVAHTDSVIYGPGAFDDIVSVSALLEGLRMLRGIVPARDLVFLFADGEEQGLLGAARFVAEHPELQPRTRLVVNVEARGNRGALLLFESSNDNLNMIRTYDRLVPHPFGFSIARQVYYMMRNDTDLSRFFMAGYPGLNLAVIQGAEVYHTEWDNVETFDRASAYHYLTTLTSLVRGLATEPELHLEAEENAVFFPLLPGRLQILPQRTADLLAWLAGGLYVLVFIALAAARRLRLKVWLGSLVTQLGLLALSGGLSYLVVLVTMRLTGRQEHYDILSFQPAQTIFIVTLALLSLLAMATVKRFFGQSDSPDAVSLGMLLLPAGLAVATTFLFASASYLFSIPVLLGLLALLTRRFIPLALPAALNNFVTLLLYVPLTALVFIALSFNTAYAAIVLWMLGFTTMLGITVPPSKA